MSAPCRNNAGERNSTATGRLSASQPPVFNFNAYSPAEIQALIETAGVKKATLPALPCFMLALVAGGSIGFGALYYCIVASDADLSFAVTRVLGGTVFSLGLAIVIIAGAELFTGNNLIVMAWASRKISTAAVLRNWLIVYVGNFVGAAGLAVMVVFSHHLDMNGGRVGLAVMTTAATKISPDVVTLFVKGVLCNLLVCLGVWLAYAGRSVTDKIAALILPISAFVAAGFEHCVANMYFFSVAWLLTALGNTPPNFDGSIISAAGIAHNLVSVTFGNIVGGSGFVGLVYWAIYQKGLGANSTPASAERAAAAAEHRGTELRHPMISQQRR